MGLALTHSCEASKVFLHALNQQVFGKAPHAETAHWVKQCMNMTRVYADLARRGHNKDRLLQMLGKFSAFVYHSMWTMQSPNFKWSNREEPLVLKNKYAMPETQAPDARQMGSEREMARVLSEVTRNGFEHRWMTQPGAFDLFQREIVKRVEDIVGADTVKPQEVFLLAQWTRQNNLAEPRELAKLLKWITARNYANFTVDFP